MSGAGQPHSSTGGLVRTPACGRYLAAGCKRDRGGHQKKGAWSYPQLEIFPRPRHSPARSVISTIAPSPGLAAHRRKSRDRGGNMRAVPPRPLAAQPRSGPGAPVTGTSTLHWSPHSGQRNRSCITPSRWASEKMPKGIPAEALHRRHKRSEAVGCAAIRVTSRCLLLRISGQASKCDASVGAPQVAFDRSRKASVFTSISHSGWQFLHRRPRRMGSGRLASVPARNGAPGLPTRGTSESFRRVGWAGGTMPRTSPHA